MSVTGFLGVYQCKPYAWVIGIRSMLARMKSIVRRQNRPSTHVTWLQIEKCSIEVHESGRKESPQIGQYGYGVITILPLNVGEASMVLTLIFSSYW